MKHGFALAVIILAMVHFCMAADEAVNVGNYSFAFNITEPHQIQGFGPNETIVKTFDGNIWITSLAWSNPVSPDYYFLGFLHKKIIDEGDETGSIYASSLGGLRFYYGFDGFQLQSTLNLTQSIDFFRDVGITRIQR